MTDSHDLLAALNAEQRRAVTHTEGPLKIVAGAGTGKTGTLTTRFAYLAARGTPPDRVLALTFSRRAAREFRERALRLLDGSYRGLWISTMHSFCLRILQEEREHVGRYNVMGEPEQRRFLARVVRDDPDGPLRSYYVGTSGAERLTADAITLIARAKEEGISVADFVEYADRRGVERLRELAGVFLAYEETCRYRGLADFGDLGRLVLETLERDPELLRRWQDRFDHVMVDEFQDTNEVQWRLLTLLAPPPQGNLTVVGDACQAIYAFRGASPRFFQRFEEEYPEATSVVLSVNYRSCQNTLDVAHALIGHNSDEEAHHLHCHDDHRGHPVRFAGFPDEDAEADYVARSILRLLRSGIDSSDCAVLCRSVKGAISPLARAFTAYGVPFQARGYDPSVDESLEDLCAVLRCVHGTGTWTDAARVLVRRQMVLTYRLDSTPVDVLAQRYAQVLGPNQSMLQEVPPLDAVTYARVTDWLGGSEAWRPLAQIREDLPSELSHARQALDALEAASRWLRGVPPEGQVYAALALVGRLDPDSATSREGRAGASVCRQALRVAHGMARAGLGIPEMLHELARLVDEERPLGVHDAGSGVAVLTLHAAKGLEWPYVFIVRAAAGTLPAPLRLDRAFDLDDLASYVRRGRDRSVAELAAEYHEEPERRRAQRYMQEERRLAYVGCTRARKQLTITFARSYDRMETEPSPFVAEMQRASPAAWVLDQQSDAGVMLPQDVARAMRRQALAALDVPGTPVHPAAPAVSDTDEGGDIVGTVLAAQWTAAQVPGSVPIRFRELPRPYDEQSTLRISFTGLDNYQTCPRRYFYGYVLGVEAPSSGPVVTLGSKLHQALRILNRHWMDTAVPPDDAEVLEVWHSIWQLDEHTITAALRDPEAPVHWEPGFSFARQLVQTWKLGDRYLRRYYRWEREMQAGGAVRVPVALEHPFRLTYRGHLMEGSIDCVLRTPRGDLIVDYKSGTKQRDLKAQHSLQLGIYERAWMDQAIADTAHPAAVAYYLLAQEKEGPGSDGRWDPGAQIDAHHFSSETRQRLWTTIDQYLARITANDFTAAPVNGKETCGRCPYSSWCEESLV